MNSLDALREAVTKRNEAIELVYAAIAAALWDGKSVQEVAETAGYHRNHIARIARSQGVPDARKRR